MKIHSLHIEGFRKHFDTEIIFNDATFLIGENNVGKSSVLKALEYLLTDTKRIPNEEFHSTYKAETDGVLYSLDKITLTAEFRNLPIEAEEWRGFKGRVLKYDNSDYPDETGNMIIYRKTYKPNENYIVEMKEYQRVIKNEYLECNTLQDYLDNGLNEEIISECFPNEILDKNLRKNSKIYKELIEMDELNDVDTTVESWVINPGGIPGNILVKLPKFLLIPAQDKVDEISGTGGALRKTLTSLYEDVRDTSENFEKVQHYLSLLQAELNPEDESTEFGEMMIELNEILGDVFPHTKLLAATNLSNADVIKPKFDIEMSSNTRTPIENQGTGVIRSAVFAMLRYRSRRENENSRPLLIGFEEPEIYLHPNAAYQMRDTIYDLARSYSNQIVCTTHSTFMIDLNQYSQVLNSLSEKSERIEYSDVNIETYSVISKPFNLSDAYKRLQSEEKSYLKMLVKMDDYMAKVFFAKNVLIVEGDTEEIVIKETIARMPVEVKKDIQHNWQIVKARGKSTIISLVRYLKSMDIHPHVMHDADMDTKGAKIFNEPISLVLEDEAKHFMLKNCIEDVLDYPEPSRDKPYKAYEYIKKSWGENWDSISPTWAKIMEDVFHEAFSKYD